MGGGLRYFGGAVAFGFAAVWILASLVAALVRLLSAGLGYGAVFVLERTRAKRVNRASTPGIAASSMLGLPRESAYEQARDVRRATARLAAWPA